MDHKTIPGSSENRRKTEGKLVLDLKCSIRSGLVMFFVIDIHSSFRLVLHILDLILVHTW